MIRGGNIPDSVSVQELAEENSSNPYDIPLDENGNIVLTGLTPSGTETLGNSSYAPTFTKYRLAGNDSWEALVKSGSSTSYLRLLSGEFDLGTLDPSNVVVELGAAITGGTFSNRSSVVSRGTISGGTYNCNLYAIEGKIANGDFTQHAESGSANTLYSYSYISDSSLSITGGTFHNGFVLYGCSTVTISGGVFYPNPNYDENSVKNYYCPTLSIYNGTFKGNIASPAESYYHTYLYGGVFSDDPTQTSLNTTFPQNYSKYKITTDGYTINNILNNSAYIFLSRDNTYPITVTVDSKQAGKVAWTVQVEGETETKPLTEWGATNITGEDTGIVTLTATPAPATQTITLPASVADIKIEGTDAGSAYDADNNTLTVEPGKKVTFTPVNTDATYKAVKSDNSVAEDTYQPAKNDNGSYTFTVPTENVTIVEVPNEHKVTLPKDDVTDVEVTDKNGNAVEPNADGTYTVKKGYKVSFTKPADADVTYKNGEETLEPDAGTDDRFTITVGTDNVAITAVDNEYTVTLPKGVTDVRVNGTTVTPDENGTITVKKDDEIKFKPAEGSDVTIKDANGDSLTPDENGDYTISADGTNSTITSEDNTYTITLPKDDVTDVEATDKNGNVVEPNADGTYTVKNGYKVSFKKPADADVSYKNGDEPLTPGDDGVYTVIVRGQNVEIKAIPNETPGIPDADISSGSGSDGAAAAALIVGGAAVTYLVGTQVWMKLNLPDGVIPTSRQQMALMLWNAADRPQPQNAVLYTDIDTADADAQAAARWCVEQGLMKDFAEGTTFKPGTHAFRPQVIKAWCEL